MAESQSYSPLPRPELFESGDLIWPKKPGAFIPYSQEAGVQRTQDRESWERERRSFLDRIRQEGTDLSEEQLAVIRDIDYGEFLARYQADRKPETADVYSSGGALSVGHVGIIDISASGAIFVIEALLDRGVVRHSYQDWLKERPGEVVWLGRLREMSKAERARIVNEAVKHVGRPYDFWNFNLNNDNGFYCSKLAWLAIFRSLEIAVDGNTDPKRGFWFSPKQLLYLPAVARLHDPGPYAQA